MLKAGLWHRGLIRQVLPPTPDPGKDWEIQVPNVPEGIWWEVLCVVTVIITSGVVGNRQLRILFSPTNTPIIGDRLGSSYAVIPTPGLIAAGSSRTFVAAQGCPAVTSSSDLTGLPLGMRLQPGHWIMSLVVGGDAADQLKVNSLLVQEWIYEPPSEHSPNVGDGAGRVDVVQIKELNETLCRVEKLLQRSIEASVSNP